MKQRFFTKEDVMYTALRSNKMYIGSAAVFFIAFSCGVVVALSRGDWRISASLYLLAVLAFVLNRYVMYRWKQQLLANDRREYAEIRALMEVRRKQEEEENV